MSFDYNVFYKIKEEIKEKIFCVWEIDEISGEIVFIGAENNHKIVEIGDVFLVKYDIDRDLHRVKHNKFEENPHLYDAAYEYLCPERLNIKNIHLTVATISFIRNQKSDVLPSGWTGAITFTGQGMEAVHPGCFLATG